MSSAMAEAHYGSFNALRSLVRPRDPRERCELCGAGLQREHQHLFEPVARKLVCSCDACAVLFHSHGETKYKRVPRRILRLRDFAITDSQWDELMIPIGIAFFVLSLKGEDACRLSAKELSGSLGGALDTATVLRESLNRSIEDRVLAFYPSPAGATESMPSLTAWEEIVEQNPVLNRLTPDVEALLANRLSGGEYYLVPIDRCYELVGLIRSHWHGLSGGAEVWKQIGSFFDELKSRAQWEPAHA